MHKTTLNIYVFLSILLFVFPASGQQVQTQLKSKLKESTNFSEIKKEMNVYYRSLSKENRTKSLYGIPKEKHYRRWEWYQSGRLGPKGDLINIDSLNRKERKNAIKQLEYSTNRSPQNWYSVGPSASNDLTNFSDGLARVDRLAFHPTNEDIIYAGTPAGGLWKTTNGGTTWNAKTDVIDSPSISGIAIDQNNPNTIFILTGDGDASGTVVSKFGYVKSSNGIYQSTNGGNTWTHIPIPTSSGAYYGYDLILHPNNSGELYAATTKGLWHRLWDAISQQYVWEFEIDGSFTDVIFHPTDPNIVYAVGNNAIYRTINASLTWGTSIYAIGDALCSGNKVRLAVSENEPNTVYAIAGPVSSAGNFCGIFKSTDSGNLFTNIRSTPNIFGQLVDGSDDKDQTYYDIAASCNPDDADELYTGGLTIWKSTNGGSTINASSGYWGGAISSSSLGPSKYVHSDIHDLKFNPVNGHIYAASDGGVYKSDDNGNTWQDITGNLAATQYFHMTGRPSNLNTIYLGAQDNGVNLRNSNTSIFDHVASGDGFSTAYSPDENNHRFFSSINTNVHRFKEDDDEFDKQTITPDDEDEMWFKNVVSHISDPNILLVGSTDIWRSDNVIANFSSSVNFDNEGASGSWAMANCPTNADRFYAAGSEDWDDLTGNETGDIYRSDNTGQTWTSISNSGFPSNYTKITDIGVSPLHSEIVCATFGGFTSGVKIVRSTNGGNSWQNISYNLPNSPVNCVALNENKDIYIGTDIGVYHLPDGSNSWSLTSPNLPSVPITDLIIYDQINFMYASTFGRGVWGSNLVDTDCIENETISSTQNGFQVHEVQNQLTSTSSISNNAIIQMKAGSRLLLKPGFKTNSSTTLFKAFLGNCQQPFETGN